MDILLYKVALIIYLLSSAGYISSLLVRRVLVARVSTWFLAAAFTIHTISILFRIVERGPSPAISFPENLSFFAWVMTATYLALQLKTKTRVLGTLVSPVVFLLMICASIRLGGNIVLPPVLQGWLVPLHVGLSLTGEALFALASCAGVMYLIQDNLIKSKQVKGFSRLLPPLMDLDKINHLCLLWGFPLLTTGILVGSIWARTAWGSLWQWDPKQVWTLLAWLFYAVLLHQRVALGWKGHKPALLSIVAFIFLLFSFVIVGLFFTTAHSFI
ncbi:MAG: cytochrome c biogenesis protein CcsA [Syntrophales bacterium]